MREEYTVLCVGGPLDGQWRTVFDRTFEALEPPKLSFSQDDTDALVEPFVHRRYRAEALALFGSRLHVAVCDGQFDTPMLRERAVMRAVLQRDVAAHLEGR